MGFEAGVFQASPIVVAVAGVQGQLGRDVDAYACHRAEAQAAAAAVLAISVFLVFFRLYIIIIRRSPAITMVGGKSISRFFSRIDTVSDVSVGDAHTDIGFEFIVGSEIVNG